MQQMEKLKRNGKIYGKMAKICGQRQKYADKCKNTQINEKIRGWMQK